MPTFPSLIGACSATRNSGRTFAVASMTFAADYSMHYTGSPLRDVTIGGSATQSWTRVPFPSGVDHLGDTPGPGGFYCAQAGCCCPCRPLFAFDDATLNANSPSAGAATLTVSLDQVDGVASTLERVVALLLWDTGAPPCRRADGPLVAEPPRVHVSLPWLLLAPVIDPLDGSFVDPVLTVAGSCSPVALGQSSIDLDQYLFDFREPTPCTDTQIFTLAVDAVWAGSQVSGSATLSFGFTLAP